MYRDGLISNSEPFVNSTLFKFNQPKYNFDSVISGSGINTIFSWAIESCQNKNSMSKWTLALNHCWRYGKCIAIITHFHNSSTDKIFYDAPVEPPFFDPSGESIGIGGLLYGIYWVSKTKLGDQNRSLNLVNPNLITSTYPRTVPNLASSLFISLHLFMDHESWPMNQWKLINNDEPKLGTVRG